MEALLEKPVRDAAAAVGAYVGRLAPSPTGALHLGNVRTFMIAWLRARSCGGKVILRIEDLDHPRDKPGASAQAVEDLKWLGFDWDEAFVQSERKGIYRHARDILLERGLLYPCVCSRKDVENAQSAPHAGEQLRYSGTCRGRFLSWQDACDYLRLRHSTSPSPCWRFRVPDGVHVAFDDVFAGPFEQDIARVLGDFPVSRDEGGAGYTLAVVVDDLLMGVTEVVRGDDLLAASPAQILVANALLASGDAAFSAFVSGPSGVHSPLGHSVFTPFRYCHVPLVVGLDGRRLAKRHGDTRIASFREAGVRPEKIIGFLAASCGWVKSGTGVSLADLRSRSPLETIPREPFVIGEF